MVHENDNKEKELGMKNKFSIGAGIIGALCVAGLIY
jgi:hypothetical protein